MPPPRKNAGQLDLFTQPIPANAPPGPPDQQQFDPGDLSDDEIITLLPRANLSNAEALATEIIVRGLGDRAVPALERLWQRFIGFGHEGPLPEQRAALTALGKIGTVAARSALATILRKKQPPDALLPLLLATSAEARVTPPSHRLTDWLEHRNPEVRAPAFALALFANIPQHTLNTGLTDPYPAVRRKDKT